MNKKLKGIVSARLPKKTLDTFNPFEVNIEVVTDNPAFTPLSRTDGGFDLFANPLVDASGVAKNTITSRVIQQIDCGVSVNVPNGYRLIIEPQADQMKKGLIIQSAMDGEGMQRVVIFAHNLGKEILVFNRGDKIARMYLTGNYIAKLNVKEKV